MNWLECNTPQEAAQAAFNLLVELIREKPDAHLALATGDSPTLLYKLIADEVVAGRLDCSKLYITALDEWWGLPDGGEGTCKKYMLDHVVGPWQIGNRSQFATPNLALSSPEEAAQDFTIRLGNLPPIDLCVLGVGINGHIGMNEPFQNQGERVHVAHLAASTQHHPMLAHIANVPQLGITMGLDDILSSHRIILLASRKTKSDALDSLNSAEVTEKWPCTYLNRAGDRVSVVTSP